MTADLVLLLRRTNSRRTRPVSASSRNVTVSPMSYIVRHVGVGVKNLGGESIRRRPQIRASRPRATRAEFTIPRAEWR
jgi:hypothetical protein